MRAWSICVVSALAAVAITAVVAGNALGENGATDKKADCNQPKRDGKEVLKISYKDNGVNKNPVEVTVDILETDTPSQKATKIAAAINALGNPNITAGAALSTVSVGGAGAGDEVTKVEWKDPPSPDKNSGEKHDSWACISGPATLGGFTIKGTASGVSLDAEPAIVQVGTGRGMAVVETTSGMTATEIRNALLIELTAMGISATASGSAGIEVEMQPLDDDKISWGSSDEAASVESSLE